MATKALHDISHLLLSRCPPLLPLLLALQSLDHPVVQQVVVQWLLQGQFGSPGTADVRRGKFNLRGNMQDFRLKDILRDQHFLFGSIAAMVVYLSRTSHKQTKLVSQYCSTIDIPTKL